MLLHVSHCTCEVVAAMLLCGDAIVQDAARCGAMKPCYDVEQGGFSRAAGAHDGEELKGFDGTMDGMQDRGGRAHRGPYAVGYI